MTFRAAVLLCLAATTAHADDAAAIKVFSAAFADTCMSAFNEDGSLVEPPQSFAVTSPSTYGDPIALNVWQFRCNLGAYNVQNVFLSHDEMNGTQIMTLAQPDLKIVLNDPADLESLPKSVTIAGWFASPFAVNPTFDPKTGELTTQGYWRGMGDASDAGVWRLVDAHFSLVRFEVDASYDEAVNPQTIYTAP